MQIRFDRGTLLLHSDAGAGEADPRRLPGVLWDQRVQCHRAPAYQHRAICAALPASTAVTDTTTAPDSMQPEGWRTDRLRDYQREALAAWETAHRRGVVVLPTGSGKTEVAIAAAARCGVPTLCVVPTRVLLGQWVERIARVYDGPVGIYGDGERRLHAVTVTTSESALRHMADLGNRFSLLIVDEVHHFGTGARDEALEMSIAPFRLGLTATPSGGLAAPALTDLIGPTVYQLGIRDLTGRHLAQFDQIVMRLPLSASERETYDRCRAAHLPQVREFFARCPFASWPDFVRSARKSAEGREALASQRRARQLVGFTAAKGRALGELLERHRQRRVLIFTADNDAAYAIAKELLIMPITCDIARTERAEALDGFRAGKLRALVSARVLNEGIDVPAADVGIIVGAALGEREHIQRIGRLLRPAPGKRALIYELVSENTHETRSAARRNRGLYGESPAA